MKKISKKKPQSKVSNFLKNVKKRSKANPEATGGVVDSITSSVTSSMGNFAGNVVKEAAFVILPAISGYAISHVVAGLGSKLFAKSPGIWQMVANPILSFVTLAGLWWGSQHFFSEYHNEIVIGAAINFVQSLVTAFMPSIAWLLGGQAPQPVLAPVVVDTTDDEPANAFLPDDVLSSSNDTNDTTNTSTSAPAPTSDFNTGIFSGGFGGSN